MGQPWRDHPSWSIVDLLSNATGRDLTGLLTTADAEVLRATRNSQIATFTLSLVILDAARRAGLTTDSGAIGAMAGHSLGEYTALVAAGVLTAEAGAILVGERGEAMQAAAEANPGTKGVAAACGGVGGAWVANDNAPGQIVIAGTVAGVEAAGARAKDLGAKRVIALPVGGAFHTPLMDPAQRRLDAALASADFRPAVTAVVANVDATEHDDVEGWPGRLSAQLCQPVRWRESLLRLSTLGVSGFVELGPGTELSAMVKRTVDGASRANVATPDDLAAVGSLAG